MNLTIFLLKWHLRPHALLDLKILFIYKNLHFEPLNIVIGIKLAKFTHLYFSYVLV